MTSSGPVFLSPAAFRKSAVRRQCGKRWLCPTGCGVVLSVLFSAAAPAFGQLETADFFKQRCFGCHTIGGGPRTGPDLKNVTQRKDRDWLIRFMMNPQEVIDSGDPYAKKLLEEARGKTMPVIAGMTRQRCEKLLDLIEEESKKEKSRFRGLELLSRPFTEADRQLGRQLFTGEKRFANGGPACISCHSMSDLPALGGGQLGGDLTHVFGKYENRTKLGTWLAAPGAPAMQPVFDEDHALTPEEIHALSAYFERSARQTPANPAVARISFLLLGLFLATALVFAFDALWKRRFHSVRRELVQKKRMQRRPHHAPQETTTRLETATRRGEA